jgi:hypothetical protein
VVEQELVGRQADFDKVVGRLFFSALQTKKFDDERVKTFVVSDFHAMGLL